MNTLPESEQPIPINDVSIDRGAIVDIIPSRNPGMAHLGIVRNLGPAVEILRDPFPALKMPVEDIFRGRGRMRIEVADSTGHLFSPKEVQQYNKAVIADAIHDREL